MDDRAAIKGTATDSPHRAGKADLRAPSERSTDAITSHVPAARQALFDPEALAFLQDFRSPTNRFTMQWLPEYRASIAKIDGALAAGRHDDLFEHFWKSVDNGIAHAGKGQLEYAAVDKIKTDLVQVIRDVHTDSSPGNVAHIVARFAAWKSQKRIARLPGLLIARVFAGIDSRRYHTTVDDSKQRATLQWFEDHTGFTRPPDRASWGAIAEALGAHLDRCAVFTDHLERNVFPWFVFEQLRERMQHGTVAPGHTPGKTTTYYKPPEGVRAVSLRHNALQTSLYLRLASAYGSNRVWTERRLDNGGIADAAAQTDNGDWHLFEIKVADTAAAVVREAMGQLLEYGFRQGGLNPTKLFAVGEPPIDDLTQAYLARLHTQFNLDITYFQITLAADGAESRTATPAPTTASAFNT